MGVRVELLEATFSSEVADRYTRTGCGLAVECAARRPERPIYGHSEVGPHLRGLLLPCRSVQGWLCVLVPDHA